MIFSGHVSYYKCEACASEFSDVTPSSLLPIATTAACATGPWSQVLSRVVPYQWLSVAIGFLVSIASLWLIYSLIDTLTTRKLRRGICPKCGATLSRAGGGWYDGSIPGLWELLIYVLAIALALGVAAVARPST